MNMLFHQDSGYISAIKSYFDQRITNLHDLYKASKQSDEKFHFEILLLSCCYIDALASIFTDEEKTGKRFVELLLLFGLTNNVSFSKVNLLFLQEQFREPIKNNIRLPEKYNKWVYDEIGKRDYAVGDNTSLDLPDEAVLERVFAISTEEEKLVYDNILKERVTKSTYASVLYENYRNPSIHEAQTKGHWSTLGEDKPFYIDVMGLSPDLSFPPLFLIKVVENILSKIYTRCEEAFYKDEGYE